MADFEGSRGRGRTSVAPLPFSRSPMIDVWGCGLWSHSTSIVVG